MNRIARQSVLAGERENATIFDPAQPALRRRPESIVPIQVETTNRSLSEPFGAPIRFVGLTVLEISYATVSKSKPETTPRRVVQHNGSRFFAPEVGPRDAVSHTGS
jgi:hypothetical protein